MNRSKENTYFVRFVKYLIPSFIFLVLVLVFYYGLKGDPTELPSPLLGKKIPTFQLPNLMQPRELVTSQIFSGHVSLLNVWASWCSSCREEHEALLKIFHTYSPKIQIFGLNYKDQREDALKWLKQLGNPYHLVIDDSEGKLGMDLGVYGTPETFIIDKQGVIRFKYVGPISAEVWQEELLPKILELL